MFVSRVLIASIGARVFIAGGLALRHPLTGLVFPVSRGQELKGEASMTVFVSCVIVASEGARVFVS